MGMFTPSQNFKTRRFAYRGGSFMAVDISLFYMYFSSSLWQFLRSFHLCTVLFVLFVLSVSGPHRFRRFSLTGIFPKMGLLILISQIREYSHTCTSENISYISLDSA